MKNLVFILVCLLSVSFYGQSNCYVHSTTNTKEYRAKDSGKFIVFNNVVMSKEIDTLSLRGVHMYVLGDFIASTANQLKLINGAKIYYAGNCGFEDNKNIVYMNRKKMLKYLNSISKRKYNYKKSTK